jgi:hypothetical protein
METSDDNTDNCSVCHMAICQCTDEDRYETDWGYDVPEHFNYEEEEC